MLRKLGYKVYNMPIFETKKSRDRWKPWETYDIIKRSKHILFIVLNVIMLVKHDDIFLFSIKGEIK